jgi:hypothetical protein
MEWMQQRSLFLKLLCVLDALLKLLESYYGIKAFLRCDFTGAMGRERDGAP